MEADLAESRVYLLKNSTNTSCTAQPDLKKWRAKRGLDGLPLEITHDDLVAACCASTPYVQVGMSAKQTGM
jgi:hypothetical protein